MEEIDEDKFKEELSSFLKTKLGERDFLVVCAYPRYIKGKYFEMQGTSILQLIIKTKNDKTTEVPTGAILLLVAKLQHALSEQITRVLTGGNYQHFAGEIEKMMR